MDQRAILQVLVPLILAGAVMVGVSVSEPEVTEAVSAILIVAGSAYAIWQRNAKVASQESLQGVIDFYDPDNDVTEAPVELPKRSYLMNEETKKWVLAGHDSINQMSLLQQIATHELAKELHYYLSFADRGGGFYEIEYGLMRGSGIGTPSVPEK